jgi:hypothetical protein
MHKICLVNRYPWRIIYMCFIISAIVTGVARTASAQQITGIWKGRIDKKKVELKIVQRGDSLTGTSYYYESAKNYRRYSIKGYFDENTNSVVWWDDQLLEEKSGKNILGPPGKVPLLSRADFNCPGEGKMLLDGNASAKKDLNDEKGPVNLEKIETTIFPDEWDYVIDNYITGTNDPDLIDSVADISHISTMTETQQPVEEKIKPADTLPVVINRSNTKAIRETNEFQKPRLTRNPTIEEIFESREKVLTKEIPVNGDSLELRFYDNAEIDGDSISLFLNDKLIFEHIRLLEKAYIIKLSVNDLKENNELIMVAENMGSIPPNTSYMVAIVGDKRYEANLASTEHSSAMIRFKKVK